jgi:hypothetical protein
MTFSLFLLARPMLLYTKGWHESACERSYFAVTYCIERETWKECFYYVPHSPLHNSASDFIDDVRQGIKIISCINIEFSYILHFTINETTIPHYTPPPLLSPLLLNNFSYSSHSFSNTHTHKHTDVKYVFERICRLHKTCLNLKLKLKLTTF